jgi:hypothetical protein
MRLQSLRTLAAAVGLALCAAPVWAAGEEVKFDSADGVELHGTYYPSTKGKKAFTVLLLHAVDPKASSKSDAYNKLAEKLQEAGHAVLAFDFRGHGDSTAITKDFWRHPVNQRYVSGFNPNPDKMKESILEKDFKQGYRSVLANDVMAAKMFLDRRNDDGQCNSGKCIIIGAGEGATLGLMFAYLEQYRYLLLPTGARETKPMGRDIAAVIGIGMTPSLGNKNVSSQINTWLRGVDEEKIPVAFIYGADDKTAQGHAVNWLKTLKVDTSKKTPDPAKPYTWHVGIAKTNLKGQALVSEKLDTISTIVLYTGKFAKDEKADNWEKREAEKNMYVWQLGSVIPAKADKQRVMNMLPLAALGVGP